MLDFAILLKTVRISTITFSQFSVSVSAVWIHLDENRVVLLEKQNYKSLLL